MIKTKKIYEIKRENHKFSPSRIWTYDQPFNSQLLYYWAIDEQRLKEADSCSLDQHKTEQKLVHHSFFDIEYSD